MRRGALSCTARRIADVRAGATLLATGGAGRIFRETTNPPIATGDGVALGWSAGAAVSDLEFVQFHPTVITVPGTPRFLLSEALRGEGARLLNVDGERFMTRYEPAGELASRDLVSRAIVREEARTGGAGHAVAASTSTPPGCTRAFRRLPRRAASAASTWRATGFRSSPAAHYMMGGVATDVWGRTTVPGLFAAGEVACTGVHGANRLASNSLLEGLVFGARAAAGDARAAAGRGARRRARDAATMPHGVAAVPAALADVQTLMWRQVGLVRDGRRSGGGGDHARRLAPRARRRRARQPIATRRRRRR